MHGRTIRARSWRALAAMAVLLAACSSGSPHSYNVADETVPGETNPPRSTTTSTSVTAPPRTTTSKPKRTSTTASTPASFPYSPTRLSRTIPASIPHDCSTDVSAAIQSWMNSIPDNAVLSFADNGCYRVDETLSLRNRRRITIDGHGATLKAVTTGDRTRQELVLTSGTDLTVRNLIVRGANPTAGASRAAYHVDLEAQHAFQLSGATNVLLDHVQAYDLYGDFVYIGPYGNKPSKHVVITNSTFERSGRQGISVTDADDVTIQANTISGAARSLFDVEPNAANQEVRSIRIIGNTTGAATNFWLADKGAAASVGDIQISGNRMVAGTGGLIFVFAPGGAYRGPFVIENNQFIATDRVHDEGSSGALFFAHARGVTISGNTVVMPAGSEIPVVELRDSHQVRLRANTFTNAGQVVLATNGSTDYDAK